MRKNDKINNDGVGPISGKPSFSLAGVANGESLVALKRGFPGSTQQVGSRCPDEYGIFLGRQTTRAVFFSCNKSGDFHSKSGDREIFIS